MKINPLISTMKLIKKMKVKKRDFLYCYFFRIYIVTFIVRNIFKHEDEYNISHTFVVNMVIFHNIISFIKSERYNPASGLPFVVQHIPF